MNMRGVFLHVMADALGSVIVIISALIMWQTDWEYKYYVDPGLSILLVLLILKSVWPLLIESALILLQTVPTHIQVDSLQQKLMAQVDGILAVHEFHIWQLAGDRIIASAHIRCLNLAQYMQVAERVKEFFHNEGIHSTTIQPEFVETGPGEMRDGSVASAEDCMLACPKPSPGLSSAPCDMSKCCPASSGRVSSSAMFPALSPASRTPSSGDSGDRRPSSVSISDGLICGVSVPSSVARRSAPDIGAIARTASVKEIDEQRQTYPLASSEPEPESLTYDSSEDTPMVGTEAKTKKVKVISGSRQSNV